MKRATDVMQNRARALRSHLTLSEVRVWGWLRKRTFDGWKFRRQFAVDRFILDFYCPELRLAIEIDGAQHHDGRIAEMDDRRTEALRRLGIVVVRVDNKTIATDPVTAEQVIEVAVRKRSEQRAQGPLRLQR